MRCTKLSTELFIELEKKLDKIDQPLVGLHLWAVPVLTNWEIYLYLLSPEEQLKVAGMTSLDRRRQFVTGRAGLRWLLGNYLGMAPQTIDISYSPTGKPILPNGNYHFNLSHAHQLVVIALSNQPVGVDVEFVHRPCNFAKISARYFPDQDWSRGDVREKFFQLWTTKEALGKAVGTGLQTLGTQVDYALHHFILPDYRGTVCQIPNLSDS